jgi:tetratricopeptide (TPR) repeat protein
VGRTVELSKLKAAFENTLTNKSSVVALQGEAGVGKTRLMQELGVYAQSKGVVILSGSASEAGLPYAPWIELTRQYVAQAPGELLRRMLGPHVSELAKLVPDIAAKLGTISPSKPLGEQQDKIRFYEGVTQFFISICSESPLLLLFDDMHLVDQSSLELLEYFVRSTSNLRVLTACSYRTEDLQSSSSLYQTLMKFNRQRLLETTQVKNLNSEETAELIKQTFGEQTISSEFADIMYQRTGGNPFFVEEVLRSLVEDGTIFRTESKWDRKPIQEIVLPESVKSVLKSRLTKLQPETLNILTMASVIGSEFGFEVLREVMQTQEDTLLDRIETVVTAGLISEVPGRKDVFRFVDNRIRELLLGDLLQSRRTRYHVKIAEAMEKAYSKNLDNRAESIAAHFSEGGDTERTIKYSLMAGDRNRAIHAYVQAIADYKRALDLIELGGGKDGEKAVAKEELAECYRMAYQLQDSTRSYQEALEIFEKLHDRKACARVCVGLSKTVIGERLSAGIRDSIIVLRRGLKYLEAEQESFEAATIYAQLASNYGIIDEWDEANGWADKALSVGEKVQNYAAIAVSLSIKGSFLTDTGRIDEGLPLWQRAFDLSLQHEQYEDAVYYLANLGAYSFPRDIAKARELAVRRIELCKRVNLVFSEAVGWLWLSEFDWYGGNWKAAREEHQKSCEIANRLGSSVALSYLALGRGRFSLSMGDLEQAEMEFQEGLDTLRENPKITDIVSYHLALGMLREEQGREREAEEHYVTCVDSFRRWEFTTSPLLHIETLLHLTSIYAKHQELEKARETSQWAKRLAETLKSDAGLALALQAEASLLIASSDRKGAEEAYLKSLSLWEKAGWPHYHAKALVAYCEAIAHTDPTKSRRHLEQAAEIFRKLGAKRDLETTEAKLSAQA